MIINDFEDEFEYDVVISDNITYHISSLYPGESSKLKKGISIYIEGEPININSILPILKRLNTFAETIDCNVHIDPIDPNESEEFLTYQEFKDRYKGDELSRIDIIVYDLYN